MGITASAPLRWSSPIKRGGATGSPDLSNSQDNSDHSKINSTVRDAVSSDTSNVNQHPKSSETPAPIPRSVSSGAKRCLVTQDSGPSVVPCYLLNPRLWRYNRMLTRLEWQWGMKYASLELEVEANMIYLREDLLESFDSNRWLLLPTPEMVNKVWDHCRNFLWAPAGFVLPSIETIYEGAEVFEYRLLPLDPRLPSFDRFDWSELTMAFAISTSATTAHPTSTHHSLPYDSLPALFSRVKPHFVICDSSPKLFPHINSVGSRLSSDVQALWPLSELDASCMLRNIDYSYRAWLERAAPPHFASSPRVLRAPSLGRKLPMTRRLPPIACVGPCFNSRFVWVPSLCSPCRGDVCHQDTSDSDDDGSMGSSKDASEHRAYHASDLIRYVGAWQACCARHVKKQGRWTSRVTNDEQLRGYAEERSQKIRAAA